MTGLQPCGTPAGSARHRNRGETPCPDCREARNAYERERRQKRRNKAAEAGKQRRQQARAARRALARLATRHDAEYKALYNRELARIEAAT